VPFLSFPCIIHFLLYAFKLISDSPDSWSDCFYVPASYSCNSGALLRGWGSNEACMMYVQRCVVLCEFIQTIPICQEILL
jgi:hypothetical protein